MPVWFRTTGVVAEIGCVGDCDVETAPEMEDALVRAARRGFRLFLIDLSRSRFLDSRGLRMLLRARGEADAAGGSAVVVGLQRQPRRALDVVGLRRVLRCVRTRAQAMAYLQCAALAA
ncbi:MAG: STAS domain-containing protein [Armatimonadetes bacterium]|nr:STAS domain-containing protein [Armatimonadota bacterium]